MCMNSDEAKENIGWFAWGGMKCRRCGDALGPWHLKDNGQEFFGCARCGFGVMCEGDGQPDCDSAADICAAMLRT